MSTSVDLFFWIKNKMWDGSYWEIEAVVRRCSVEQVFLKISQNSQENTCPRVSFLLKLQAPPATLLKKRIWSRCFPVNFAKFLRTTFFIEHIWWLLLKKVCRSTQNMFFTHYNQSNTFCWLTCRKQKLVQSKILQQRLLVLILGFWQFRQVFVNY